MSTGQPVDVPPHVLEFVDQGRTLTLATASPAGIPRASTFLYVNDGSELYFWMRAGATSARQIEQNPAVSFAIDEYADDLSQTRGVQGMGECSVLLRGEQIARVADLFGQKYPNLAPGTTMSISFFRIVPTELQFIDNSSGSSLPEGSFGADFHSERAYSVFSDLPLQTAEQISAPLQILDAQEGEVIVRQGGPADKFFIVVDGEVEVLRDGESEPVATLGPAQFFGEVAIMRDRPRTAGVRASAPSKLFAIERDTFRDIVAQALETTAGFEQVIQDRLGPQHEGRRA